MSEGPNRPRYVSVIGPGDADEETYGLAREVGRLVAEPGGVAIGVLPDEDRRRANPHLSHSIPTGIGQARNLAVVCSADAVIAVGGGYGTL